MAAQAPTQASPKTPLPPILALPLELTQQIISYLSGPGDDKQHNIITMMILRRTHPVFRNIIPRNDQPVSRDDLFYAEEKHSYLIPPDHYPCYDCHKVLHGSNFFFFYTIPKLGSVLTEKEMYMGLGDTFRDCGRCDGCQRKCGSNLSLPTPVV